MKREKRQHARIHVELAGTLALPEQLPVPMILRDIGIGGMFVECPIDLPFGASVTLTFTLPGEAHPMDVPCTVRWTKLGGFGLQIGLLGAHETHALTRFVRDASSAVN